MSLGSASLLCATIASLLWNSTHNIGLTIGLTVLLGAGLGIINAVFATMLGLPVMVMTLTMMNIISAINEPLLGSLMKPDEGLPKNALVYGAILIAFFIYSSVKLHSLHSSSLFSKSNFKPFSKDKIKIITDKMKAIIKIRKKEKR